MKVGIIGATGNAGAAIFKEAQQRGHEVVAIVRNAAKAKEQLGENSLIIEKDAFSLAQSDL
ncbi:NAD(P)H-binding protein, partial [Enterococcus sp.]